MNKAIRAMRRTLLWILGQGLILTLIFFQFGGGLHAATGKSNSGTIGTTVVPTAVGHLVVLHVIKNSPADRQGILPGDLIVEVNGVDLKGSDFSEVVKSQLWGEKGTTVVLKVLRPGKSGAKTYHLTRTELTQKGKELPGVKMIHPQENDRKSP